MADTNAPKTIRLFVYGTLMRDQPRAALLQGYRFLGQAQTAPHYRLFRVHGGCNPYPGLVQVPREGLIEEGVSIQGELYEVDEPCMAELDIYEDVPHGLYARHEIELLGESEPAVAYLYLHPVVGCEDCSPRWRG